MSQRTYTEEEVTRLIRRAVELEAERSVNKEGGNRTGLTLADLEEIAAESGIDPDLIKRAASEFDRDSSESKDKGSTANVTSNEIICERWIDAQPGDQTLKELVTELNHRFGTSEDDINWWHKLWNDYAGVAKTRKTANSLEWEYLNDGETETTRVLFQKRGERFRIRVSKRRHWGLKWDSPGGLNWVSVSFFSIVLLMSGLLGHFEFDELLASLAAGTAICVLTLPLVKIYERHKLTRSKKEITDLTNELVDLADQLQKESAPESTSGEPASHPKQHRPTEPTGGENIYKNTQSRLRNQLR